MSIFCLLSMDETICLFIRFKYHFISFSELQKYFHFNSFQNFTNTIPFQLFLEVSKYHFISFSELHKYYSISILYRTSQILFYHFNSFRKFMNTILLLFFSELHKYYSISILYKTSQILLHFNSFWKFTNTISSHFQKIKITIFRSLRKPFHFKNFTNTNIPFELFSENKKYYLISIRFGSYHLIKVP